MSFWNGREWVADPPPVPALKSAGTGRTRHVAVAIVRASLVTALTFGMLAGTVFAAKGGGGGAGSGGGGGRGGHNGGSTTSSLAVVMVSDSNGNGAPDFRDTITFKVSTTATQYPYVDLGCYQGGTLVMSASAGFYPSYPWPGAQNIPLSSPSWTGGAADCVATLNGSLASLSFHVGP